MKRSAIRTYSAFASTLVLLALLLTGNGAVIEQSYTFFCHQVLGAQDSIDEQSASNHHHHNHSGARHEHRHPGEEQPHKHGNPEQTLLLVDLKSLVKGQPLTLLGLFSALVIAPHIYRKFLSLQQLRYKALALEWLWLSITATVRRHSLSASPNAPPAR
jgi:hypothetical protein